MIEVVNIKTCKDWGKLQGDVYIGRGSHWGNPFKMLNDSDAERTRVIEEYKVWFEQHPKKMAELVCARPLRLGCYCKPKACHGDYLKEKLDQYNKIVGSTVGGYLGES